MPREPYVFFRDPDGKGVERLGIEDEWNRFRDATFQEIAKEWLETNDSGYE